MSKASKIINLICVFIISGIAVIGILRILKSDGQSNSSYKNELYPDQSWHNLEIEEFDQKKQRFNGVTYYVDSKNGSDNNSGIDEKLAFKTINKANRQVTPGDRVLVKNGTYEENITVTASGEKGNWIVFQAFPGHKPFVKGTKDGIFRVKGNYIKILGFRITSTKNGSGIHVGNDNHHTQIINNEIHDSGCGGISGMRTDYLYIEGNTVYRNAFTSHYQCSGISIYQAQAIDNRPGFHNIIRGNISYSNKNKNTRKDGTVTDGNGIIIDDFRHTQINSKIPPYKPWTLVENNVVFDNGGRGIHVFLSDNVIVRNNTAFKNLKSSNLDGHLNGELTTSFSSNVHFYNNIAYSENKSKKTLVDDYSQGNTWDYNLTYKGQVLVNDGHSDVVLGKNNLINVDPLFLNPSLEINKANFQIQPNSPAKDKGTSKNPTQIDLQKRQRPLGNGYDIGAYEYK